MVSNASILAPPHRQTALDFLADRQDLAVAIDAFLTDRRSKNRSPRTVKYYGNYLRSFETYSKAQAATLIRDLDPSILRMYILGLGPDHNPGGIHAAYRALRAFLLWVEREELMPPDWKNPIKKVDAPFVPEQVIEPISLQDVHALVAIRNANTFLDKRDRAVVFLLLDTGARAQEVCNMDLVDVELGTGQVTIREGKGGKPRYVFIGKKTSQAIRAYLRLRSEHRSPALFVSNISQRLTYDGLRQLIQRRSRLAGLQHDPTLHDFRRAFAVNMLRNGADIFSLQRLMGHKDISILRRYLAQRTEDIRATHEKCSPVENYSWA